MGVTSSALGVTRSGGHTPHRQEGWAR